MYSKVFSDLDGTIYLGGEIIDSVDREIRRLSAAGVEFFYLTNNTSMSTDEYVEKLKRLDLPVSRERILSPTRVLKKAIADQQWSRIYTVGTRSFVQEICELENIQFDLDTPEVVIVAYDKDLTYEKLERACGLINRGIPYYLTHIDLACPSPVGPIPDCGAIGRLLEASTGVAPCGHFGKPGKELVSLIKGVIGQGEHILVAGDRSYTDAALGLALGATTLLVRSGEFSGTINEVDEKVIVADTLAMHLRELETR